MTAPGPLADQIPESQEEAPGKPRRRRPAILAASGGVTALLIILGALFAAGVFSGQGTITAHGSELVFANPLDGQNVQNAYPDISDGTQVTVVNSSGTVVGTGTLQSDPAATVRALKSAVAGISGLSASDFTSFVAEYDFTVTVPGGLARYGIRAGQNRGTTWLTPQQMRNGPALSLGSLSG